MIAESFILVCFNTVGSKELQNQESKHSIWIYFSKSAKTQWMSQNIAKTTSLIYVNVLQLITIVFTMFYVVDVFLTYNVSIIREQQNLREVEYMLRQKTAGARHLSKYYERWTLSLNQN